MRVSLLLLLAACAHLGAPVPFGFVARKVIVLPMQVAGISASFVLDTGAGLSFIDEKLCEQAKCKTIGAYTARKASGQPFTVPLAAVSSLCVQDHCQKDVLVGVLPMGNVQGLLSLKFFAKTPFTLNYARAELRFDSVEGDELPLRIDEDGPSLLAFMPLTVGEAKIHALVDTSADTTVLDTGIMPQLGVEDSDPAVRTMFGKDETGSQFVRYSTTLARPIAATASARQTNSEVIFQHLIYEGLIGQAFLRVYTITYDLARSRMIIARP